jgi:hypothetical protein
MEKIFGAALTLVLFLSISLIMNSSNVQIASAVNIPRSSFSQDMLKQKLMQSAPDEQMPNVPPTGEQFPSSEGEMTIPNQETTQPPPKIEQYRANVKFDQITVHNDHEGALSGDGEYELFAYVHGLLVDLTKLSQWRDAGLTDVSSGETVKFRPGNFMAVNIDSTLPLTIVTAGTEHDGCKNSILPSNIQPVILSMAANETAKALGAPNGTQRGQPNAAGSENKGSGPSTLGSAGAAAGTAVGQAYGGPAGAAIGAAVGGYVSSGLSKLACKVNPDDKIGILDEGYIPTSYGAGPHTVQSDSKDYTLTYTIQVQRVQ